MTGLFDGLFDDAALFPPGEAPMAAAVPAHRAARTRWGGVVGPFVVPAARLDELTTHLVDDDLAEPFGISLITAAVDLRATTSRVRSDPRLALAAVEVPVVADADNTQEAVRLLAEALPAGVPAVIEVPRTAARDHVLDVLAGTGYRAKVRTGDLRAELFPDAGELAGALHACLTREVAVKCTAGLHSAVRHTDPVTGFEHHGFLNVLLAVDALAWGAPPSAAAGWLADPDGSALATALGRWPASRAARVRALFTSFGTCSVAEPVTDLVALGLLPAPERTPA